MRHEDELFHAFHNRCTHFGHRRLDYVRGTNTVQCCSINKSTYTFAGKKIHGPNPKPVDTYPIKKDGDNLYIKLS
jgi:nitrite reductase/ring-hydroxylating ferredoxin subunit